MSKKQNFQQISYGGQKLIVVIAIIIVSVLAVTLLAWYIYDDYIGGPEYRAAKEKCGGEPVAGFGDIKRPGDRYYKLPTGLDYHAPSFSYDTYFCTEQGAIDAGYQRSRYN